MFKYSRTSTLIGLGNIDKRKWDEQPDGYPNTIRWNAGHVFCTAEEFLNKADDNYEVYFPEWNALFIDGTHPSQWNGKAPSADDIIAALKEQGDRIYDYFNGKLQNEATEHLTFHSLTMDTAGASLQFVTWHEGIHLGIIKSLSNAIK